MIRYFPGLHHDMHKGCAHLKGWDQRCDECRIKPGDKMVVMEEIREASDYNIESYGEEG